MTPTLSITNMVNEEGHQSIDHVGCLLSNVTCKLSQT